MSQQHECLLGLKLFYFKRIVMQGSREWWDHQGNSLDRKIERRLRALTGFLHFTSSPRVSYRSLWLGYPLKICFSKEKSHFFSSGQCLLSNSLLFSKPLCEKVTHLHHLDKSVCSPKICIDVLKEILDLWGIISPK